MPLLLLRHAWAGDSANMEGRRSRAAARRARARGRPQQLVEQLAAYRIDAILTSPYVRCVETVQPLAAARGLAVEEREELGRRAAVHGGHRARPLARRSGRRRLRARRARGGARRPAEVEEGPGRSSSTTSCASSRSRFSRRRRGARRARAIAPSRRPPRTTFSGVPSRSWSAARMTAPAASVRRAVGVDRRSGATSSSAGVVARTSSASASSSRAEARRRRSA